MGIPPVRLAGRSLAAVAPADVPPDTADLIREMAARAVVTARGAATEIYAAFEACREKMDKQLRRYKRRLKYRHVQSSFAESANESVDAVAQALDLRVGADATEDGPRRDRRRPL